MSGEKEKPLFSTFDTSSLKFKRTSRVPDPGLVQDVSDYLSSLKRPVIVGEISLRFDLRLDMTIEIVEILLDRSTIRKLDPDELSQNGFHPLADVYVSV